MAKNKRTPENTSPQPKPATMRPAPVAAPAAAAAPGGLMEYKWFLLALILIGFVINLPTLNYQYTLDDPFFTKDNPLVKEGTANLMEFFKHAAYYGVFKYHDASYRPLMLISFAIENEFFGFDPKIGHLVNLIIFCIQIVVLFLVLRRVFHKMSPWIPFFIMLLFELHPIHTEVVASIKSRDELLSLLLSGLTMLLSFKYIDTDKNKYLAFSAIVFFFALMSKETSICFVGIVPMSIYFFRDVSIKKIAITVAPYLVVSVIYMGMRAAFIESDGEKVRILVNNNALMAAANYGEKLATALFIQLKYVQLLVFPHPLSYDYSYNQIPIIDFTNPKGLLSLLVFIGLSVFAVVKLPKKNIYSYSILFYFALVVLTSNLLVDIGATAAERFVYSASLGFCIALVFGVLRLLKADPANITLANAKAPMAVIAIIAILYSVKTIARNEAWSSNLALYETGIETAPNSWRAHNLLGVEYTKMISAEKDPKVKNDLFRKSVYHFDRSLEILPGSPEVMLLKGYAYDFMGRDDSAVLAYAATLKMDTNNQKAANNLGAVYLRQGKFAEAIGILSRVVAKDPTYSEGMVNLAASYGNSGNFKESINYYEKAYKVNPNPPRNVLQSMCNVYRFLGDSVNSQKFGALAAKAQ